ncbi:MAG: insulinase family protein [Gemmatimonadetes bacterium]|nr:insulinase family protein [Gemmatimonadota bacterium]
MRSRWLSPVVHGMVSGALALLAAPGLTPLAAQEPSPVRVESFTLPNGLRVHMVEDHTAQVVAVNVWYDVGSRNERAGRTGFAHLFEHMMFQGSANVQKAEHGQLIERAGGSLNGSTQPDRTNYYNEVPSNRLNLALWLEADRMRSLAITAENLKNQQEAVKEERRLRFDNQPYFAAFVDSLPTMFDRERCFAYSHSIIGSMDDLNAATVEDVKAFFDLYYAPNNAILVITGDFRPATARQLVRDYFGGIPAGKPVPAVTCAAQAATGSEVVKRIPDRNANLPAVLTAYRAVPPSHADYPALELLSTILGAGESSRLNRALVREAKVAVAAQALFNPFGPMRGAGVFGALVIANQGVDVDTLHRSLLREMRTAAEGITAEELTKAKNSWRSGTIFGRQTAIALSEAVHYAAMFLGSPEAINADAARYEAVTVADLRRVAATYVRPENSLTLLIVPEGR